MITQIVIGIVGCMLYILSKILEKRYPELFEEMDRVMEESEE